MGVNFMIFDLKYDGNDPNLPLTFLCLFNYYINYGLSNESRSVIAFKFRQWLHNRIRSISFECYSTS